MAIYALYAPRKYDPARTSCGINGVLVDAASVPAARAAARAAAVSDLAAVQGEVLSRLDRWQVVQVSAGALITGALWVRGDLGVPGNEW